MRRHRQQAYLYDTYFVNLLEDFVAVPHQHGVYQLVVSLDHRPCSAGPDLTNTRPGLLHLIGSNEVHAVDGQGGQQAVIWVAPESTLGRQLAAEYLIEQPIAVLPDELYASLALDSFRQAFREHWDAERFRPAADEFFAGFSKAVPRAPTALHPGIRKAIQIIRGLDEKRISATALSDAVGLSKSHFLRLFKEHMGTPLRPYLQWIRCLHAYVLITDGASVADAAARAGFTDGAHLNRVTWRAFAMNPTDLARTTANTLSICLSDPPDQIV